MECKYCGLEVKDCTGHTYIGTLVDLGCQGVVHVRNHSHIGKLPHEHFAEARF